jgi:phage terminase large subunit
MAMSEIWFHDGEYYIRELIYESGLTTLTPPGISAEEHPSLVSRMESLRISLTDDIYCDSAEPDRIQELCNSGYNAKPSRKDVKSGIDFVKGSTIHVDALRSPNIETEFNNYKWKENKAGESLDEPVKAFDHQMDCIRYPIFTAPTEPIEPAHAVSKAQMSRPSFSGFASSRPHF